MRGCGEAPSLPVSVARMSVSGLWRHTRHNGGPPQDAEPAGLLGALRGARHVRHGCGEGGVGGRAQGQPGQVRVCFEVLRVCAAVPARVGVAGSAPETRKNSYGNRPRNGQGRRSLDRQAGTFRDGTTGRAGRPSRCNSLVICGIGFPAHC